MRNFRVYCVEEGVEEVSSDFCGLGGVIVGEVDSVNWEGALTTVTWGGDW